MFAEVANASSMKIPATIACLVIAAALPLAVLAETAPAPAAVPITPAAADLQALKARISAKIKAGAEKAAEFAEEAAAFDALLAKYAGDKSEGVAQIAFAQATFSLQILENTARALAQLERVQTNYAGTKAASSAVGFVKFIGEMEQAKILQAKLVGQPAPELHFTWASRDGLHSLADLKGKVVVLDFWATWCGPCIQSFPHVRELAQHYAGAEVVVLGVTSLQGFVKNLAPERIDTKGDPAREVALTKDFVKAKDMTWTVAISEEKVFNPAYGITGIPAMVVIAPDGTVRNASLDPWSPQAEKQKLIDGILREFSLHTPTAGE